MLTLQSVNGTLYEKIINVYFYDKFEDPITNFKQSIICNPFGYKPKMELSGSIIPNSLYTHVELRVTNGCIHFDATSFQKIVIDAGYYNSITTGSIIGRITQAYVESPGPDGVTVFIILIGSEEFVEKSFVDNSKSQNVDYFEAQAGSTFKAILNSFVDAVYRMGLTKYDINISDQLGNKIYGGNASGPPIKLYGSIATIIQELCNVHLKVAYSIKGSSISIFTKRYGSSVKATKIEQFSSTPAIRVKGHINFQSPWIPGLMPGDYIFVDPGFMKMTFGGWQTTVGGGVKAPSIYNILKIDFDFSTIEKTNVMTVDALSSDDQDFTLEGSVM